MSTVRTDAVDASERVLVEGAGNNYVYGLYRRHSTQDNVGRYLLQGDRQAYFLQRCETDGSKNWCICDASTNTSSRVLFSAPVSDEDPDYPPSRGWVEFSYSFGSSDPSRFVDQSLTVTVIGQPQVIPTTTIFKAAASTYKNLLFSEEFSDVQFICEDGVAIAAHKNILAASSQYFAAVFRGPWRENKSGVLETSHPAHIIREMLELIYTGETSSQLVQEAPLEFLSVATEFDLPWLKKLAEPSCILSLNSNNLKVMWQAGRLYDSDPLKTACINYTKKNALSVLTNSSIIDIKSEDPASWKEFVGTIAGNADFVDSL